jgi:hypothetical protein
MDSPPKNSTPDWYSYGQDFNRGPLIRFWLFLIFDLLAVICNTFVLYHLLSTRKSRKALHNHVPIIILLLVLIFDLIDIPLHLQFLSTGIVRPTIPVVCLIWWFIDWGFYYIIAVLLVFASFERHILIFHSQMVVTRRKRLFFHYFPLLVIVLFMMTFYSVAIFAPICESTFDYTSDLCGTHACYGLVPFFAIVEQMIFSVASAFLIAILSITLLARVIWQKHRIHRAVQWRKQRKLGIQVVAVSLLYLTFSFPLTLIYLVRSYSRQDWGNDVLPVFFFLSYFAVLLLPFVYLASIPKLWNKMKRLDPRGPRRVAVLGSHP